MNDKKLEFWNARAKLGDLAGTNDARLKELEMATLAEYVHAGQRVLDIGCGNGTTAFKLIESVEIELLGLDFSPEMIAQANQERDRRNIDSSKLNFATQDIRALDEFKQAQTSNYDVIISERVLINLSSWDEQKKAIREIVELLRPGGIYLMCENLAEGLDNLNKMRKQVGLEPIISPWHNRYLHTNEIGEVDFADLIECRDFTSAYYFLSRVVNAWLAGLEREEPQYDAPINGLAICLRGIPSLEMLDLGQTRLWVWRRPVR